MSAVSKGMRMRLTQSRKDAKDCKVSFGGSVKH